ncbi:hypothetical protein [Noviherbaspirillum pedocola]|uniref:Uncharacterized protein n=1 Tax=Noviherbaspirillum pedocola TaxID=2801341 RepID=A0A934SRV1_9BURK|nr:hypothetical protein [Noviherbaspirillum pedocola]MBK4735601.1 hypothetical protein [Noviherbaspirillum pedocola]
MQMLAAALIVTGANVSEMKISASELGKAGFDALSRLIDSNSGPHALDILDLSDESERP